MNRQQALLIEMSPYIREALQETLQVHGVQLTCAESGEAGVRLMRSQRFDAVICNFHLPGISGLEFFWKVERLLDRTVSILMASSGDDYLANAAMETGVDYFLQMPFKVEDLVCCLKDGKPAGRRSISEFGFLTSVQSYSIASRMRHQAANPAVAGPAAGSAAVRVTRFANKAGGTLKVFHNSGAVRCRNAQQPDLKLISRQERDNRT